MTSYIEYFQIRLLAVAAIVAMHANKAIAIIDKNLFMLYIILMFIFSDVDDAFLGSYLQSCDILYCIESLSHRFVFVNAACESQFFHVFGRELHLHVVPMGDNFHQILQRAAVEQEVARVPRGVKINIHLLDVRCSACFQGCHIAWFQQVFFTVLAAHTNFTFHRNNAGYTFSFIVLTLNSVP